VMMAHHRPMTELLLFGYIRALSNGTGPPDKVKKICMQYLEYSNDAFRDEGLPDSDTPGQTDSKKVTAETQDNLGKTNDHVAGRILSLDSEQHSDMHKRWLFICYCLGGVNYGCLETMISSLFSDITQQLHISELETSYIVLGRAFSYIVSTFVAAFVMDRFHASHRYYAAVLIVAAMSTVLIPFSKQYSVHIVLWAMTGYAHGTLDTCLPVYAYRAWTESGSIKYVTFLATKGLTNVTTPLLIQFCVITFGTYSYAVFTIAVGGMAGGVMALCLQTPQHDSLRSIQAAIRRRSSTRESVDVQQDLAVHNKLKNTVVMLLCTQYIMHGVVQSGTLTHATVYCSEYLGVSNGIGRFLISMYCGGQLAFRLLHSVVPPSVQIVLNSVDYMIRYLSWMVVTVACLSAVWLFIPIEYKLFTLYLVFPVMGFVIGGIGPYSVRLVESITPVSGTISCLFMMFCGAGDFLIVLVNGELIQYYGARVQPASISAYCLFGIPVFALTFFLYRKYQYLQDDIVGGFCVTASRKNEGEPHSAAGAMASTLPSSASDMNIFFERSDDVRSVPKKRVAVATVSQSNLSALIRLS